MMKRLKHLKSGYRDFTSQIEEVFVDVENYTEAVAAVPPGVELMACHILVTHRFLDALKAQVKTVPRVKVRRETLLANFFGVDGAELRTASSPSEYPPNLVV